jgi:hypothetical protein
VIQIEVRFAAQQKAMVRISRSSHERLSFAVTRREREAAVPAAA